ncbi:hypothetical protein BKA81DRAFT_364470 [Phyllosticta paracitricarpa]
MTQERGQQQTSLAKPKKKVCQVPVRCRRRNSAQRTVLPSRFSIRVAGLINPNSRCRSNILDLWHWLCDFYPHMLPLGFSHVGISERPLSDKLDLAVVWSPPLLADGDGNQKRLEGGRYAIKNHARQRSTSFASWVPGGWLLCPETLNSCSMPLRMPNQIPPRTFGNFATVVRDLCHSDWKGVGLW